MIKGEFLAADDLGPLGRLVAPGELLVMEKRDAAKILSERAWVSERYLASDARAEDARLRLRTAAANGTRGRVRAEFEDWTAEAAKLALCGRYLLMVGEQLDAGKQQALNPKKGFTWGGLPQIADLVGRLLSAPDREIIDGAVFRVR